MDTKIIYIGIAIIALIKVEKQMLLTGTFLIYIIIFWVIPPINILPNITFECSHKELFTGENILVKKLGNFLYRNIRGKETKEATNVPIILNLSIQDI